MIRFREEDNEKPKAKKIKTISEHPDEGPDINRNRKDASPAGKSDDMVREHGNLLPSRLPHWSTQGRFRAT
jgi:hypothetical protein